MSTSRTSPREYWALLAHYLAPQRGRTALLGLLLAATIAFQLGTPLVLRRFIDRATEGATLRTLLVLAALYIVFAIAVQAIRLAETWVATWVGLTATNNLRSDLAQHVLGLDMSYHNRQTPGALIERVDGDVGNLAEFFSTFVVTILGNLLLAAGVIVLLITIDWRIGLAVAGFAVLIVTTMALVSRWNSPRYMKARQANAELMGFYEERMNGTEDIRSAGANAYVMHRSHDLERAYARRQVPAVMLGWTGFTLSSFLNVLLLVTALAIAATRFDAGAITVGTVFVVYQYCTLLNEPLDQLAHQLSKFQLAAASVGRIQQLLEEEPTIADGPGHTLHRGALDIAFDHVVFGYGSDEPVLRDVSFTVPAGRVLGVVGRTGSGKSTLTRLLVRFHDPAQGAVRLGGVDVRDLTSDQLRQRVALVTQEIQLFRATVRDNLTLFNREIPDARVVSALQHLGLGDWLASLEDELDTMLASGGGVSAGEAQLLAFTRVFLRDPDVVIMDEASSRLDPATEARLERAIDTLLEGRTGIVIAHRLATIERADDILVMAGGKVVEHGRRLALAGDTDSQFAAMLRSGHDLVTATEGAP